MESAGERLMTSWMSRTLLRSIISSLSTEIARGTCSSFSTRLLAVTVIDSSLLLSFSDPGVEAGVAVAAPLATAGVGLGGRGGSTDAGMRGGTEAGGVVLCTSLSSVEVVFYVRRYFMTHFTVRGSVSLKGPSLQVT